MWFVGLRSQLFVPVVVGKNVAINLHFVFLRFQVDDSISFGCSTNSILRLKINALKTTV